VAIEKTSNSVGRRCSIGDECQITDELAATWFMYEREGAGQISTCTGHAVLSKEANQPASSLSLITPDRQICFFPHGAISMADDSGQQCRFGINGFNQYWPRVMQLDILQLRCTFWAKDG
jgi:hypothetical protein